MFACDRILKCGVLNLIDSLDAILTRKWLCGVVKHCINFAPSARGKPAISMSRPLFGGLTSSTPLTNHGTFHEPRRADFLLFPQSSARPGDTLLARENLTIITISNLSKATVHHTLNLSASPHLTSTAIQDLDSDLSRCLSLLSPILRSRPTT